MPTLSKCPSLKCLVQSKCSFLYSSTHGREPESEANVPPFHRTLLSHFTNKVPEDVGGHKMCCDNCKRKYVML